MHTIIFEFLKEFYCMRLAWSWTRCLCLVKTKILFVKLFFTISYHLSWVKSKAAVVAESGRWSSQSDRCWAKTADIFAESGRCIFSISHNISLMTHDRKRPTYQFHYSQAITHNIWVITIDGKRLMINFIT